MTRRVALLLVPLLLMHAPRAHAVGQWLMGGPVAALGTLSRLADHPAEPAAAPTPVTASPALPARELTQLDHQVIVTLENGFARTEVTQVWENPNRYDCEARYAMPLPRHAALSELRIVSGATVLAGEVRGKDEAERIYQEEKAAGHDAAVARKDEYRTYEFAVARVPAQARVQVRFVYYQPLRVDTGVARYTYPIAHDGGGEGEKKFWSANVTAQAPVHLVATVKAAFPVEDVRTTGPDAASTVKRVGPGELVAETTANDAGDITVYYRLAKLPGRVEVIPYRAPGAARGTYMAVLTPGGDLPLIASGADHIFVLDVSGSMRERIAPLTEGVVQALGTLEATDRFRVLAFSDVVNDLTGAALPATPDNVARAIERVRALTAGGGTNLFDALKSGLELADGDRVTNVILVTDGVTNQGELSTAEFRRLLTRADVRFHGILMGNEANWPLMDAIAKASGGHYESVVSSDDIAGVLRLARGKLVSEAIHDVKVQIDGGDVTDQTAVPGRVYHGEQLVLFGRYTRPGPATISMTARIAGKPYTYTSKFEFPATDTRVPELERLYGLARCEEWKQASDAGLMPEREAQAAIRALGIESQIVTDETSMVLLTDGQFAARGIHRDNAARSGVEQVAQVQRAAAPAPSYTTYQPPAYTPPPAPHVSDPAPSYHHGHGGGAFDPISGLMVLALAGLSMGKKEEE